MTETGRPVLVKTGADGCYTAILTHQGYGVSLKIDDGDKKAAEVLLGAVLRQLNALTTDQSDALADYFLPEISNSRGDVVGRYEIASESGLG